MIRVYRHYISSTYLWLLISEWVVFFISMYLGALARFIYRSSWYSGEQMLQAAIVYSLVVSLCCSGIGLYRKTLAKDEYNLLERISYSFGLAILLLAFVYYIIPNLMLARSVLVCALIFSFIGLMLTRYMFYHYASHHIIVRRVLVIGSGERARELELVNSGFVHRGFEIIAYVSLENEVSVVKNALEMKAQSSLIELVESNNIDEVVIAVDDRRNILPVDQLLDIKMAGVQVMDLLTFYEREQQLVYLDVLTPSWLVFSDGFTNGGLRPLIKRCFDIIASLVLLLATWWIMILTVFAIYFESGFGAPILYRQKRVGFRNKTFDVIKFRSMHVDAEKNGAQWASQTDKRVTKVGRFIRLYRIDELPQLFNVFKGNMSFVGPRPERPEFVEGFSDNISYYNERHRVKPGITGWAQLCYPYGANEYDTRQKLQYDLYYVKNYSLFLDFTIMMSTIEVILWGRGAR